MRKVETFAKQLLDEWSGLPEDKKEEAISVIASRFVERVPAEQLATMAEQFVAASEGGPGHSSAAGNANVEDPAPEEQDYVQAGSAEDNGEEQAEAVDGVEEKKPRVFSSNLPEALKELVQTADGQSGEEWSQAWSSIVPKGEERQALIVLFEACLRTECSIDLTATVVVELARLKTVELKGVEFALQAVAGRLEEFVEANENCWNLHSHLLMQLFPKTPSTAWGFPRPGWTWTSWWLMAEKVLLAADHFRAFDILVLVLQMMQEKSGNVIKKLQVWKEGGRTKKVQKVLCDWGEMDSASIVETLTAYGVELA